MDLPNCFGLISNQHCNSTTIYFRPLFILRVLQMTIVANLQDASHVGATNFWRKISHWFLALVCILQNGGYAVCSVAGQLYRLILITVYFYLHVCIASIFMCFNIFIYLFNIVYMHLILSLDFTHNWARLSVSVWGLKETVHLQKNVKQIIFKQILYLKCEK